MSLKIVAAILTAGQLRSGRSTVECVESYSAMLDLLQAEQRERRVRLSPATSLEDRQQ